VKESFATTHWSLVLAAGNGASADAQEALAALCRTYWYPLYAYVRRQGHQPDDAQDLTQAFFARLLEKHYLQSADPERGRFRSFLVTAFKRFLSKEHDRERTKRRGGGSPGQGSTDPPGRMMRLMMKALHEDPHFTFRFAEDRGIPRFHLEDVPAGQGVSAFRINVTTGERLRLLAMAAVGETGWVDLGEPIMVRAGEAFIVVLESAT